MAEGPFGRDAFLATLDARAEAGRPASFWLRDDDATGDSEALRRLLAVAAEHGIAPVIAAVPEHSGADLIEVVQDSRARIAVHGVAHRNHAPPGAKKAELGADRPADFVIGELARARESLAALANARFLSMLVPPWNRIAPSLVPLLGEAGIQALSTFGPRPSAEPAPGLVQINTHLDIMDWRGNRGGRPVQELFSELARLVAEIADREPIGILSHHLVHDRMAWQFLEALFAVTKDQEGARWLAGDEVLSDHRVRLQRA